MTKLPLVSYSTSLPTRSPWPLIALLLLVLSASGATGYGYYQEQKHAIEQAAREQLRAIGNLKAQEIGHWLEERGEDAVSLFNSPLATALEAVLTNPGALELRQEALTLLSSLSNHYGYSSAAVVDPGGQIILTVPTTAPVSLAEQTQSFVQQALDTRQVLFSDLYSDGTVRLDFIVPLLAEPGGEAPPIGALLLRIDPYTQLFPLMQRWPTPSPSAETSIVRQEGDEIVFLNELRHHPGSALSLRLPRNGTSPLLTVLALGDWEGELEGIDYRGVAVLAAIRHIPNAPWTLVAKVDRQEIKAPIQDSAVRALLMLVLLMLTASLLAWVLWRRQTEAVLLAARQTLEAQVKEHTARLEAEITEHKACQAQLEYQANHDSLTQLPNRSLCQDRLRHAIAQAQRSAHRVAVLFMDLDRFKMVNDSLGHDVGDTLLQTVAARLKACVREGDTVARLGGDEFVIILENLRQEELVAAVARKVLETMSMPFAVAEQEFFINCSIGISLFPSDGEDTRILLKNADIALQRAKGRGRNNIQFYATELNAQAFKRLTLENDLRHALEAKELLLYYQPQVDLASGKVTGMEVLLRWQHPKLGMISPPEFVPLAEETGLIVPIGEWVFKTVCAQAKAWQDDGLPALTMGVNLSVRQFMQAKLTDRIAQILKETGLEPRYLELELTESLLMHDVEGAIATLHTFKAMGVSLTIDDFGTGYSSLSHLKRFPLDRLKIDQSFVNTLTTNPDNAAIAMAVIAMGHSLRLKVIAEGVETEGQLAFLKLRRCDEIQGYYFSHPLPSEAMAALLRENRTLRPDPDESR